MATPPPAPTAADVEALLLRAYIGDRDPRTGRALGLRREDLKKAREVAAFLGELRALRRDHLVDAAAGHGYVGLLAAALLGVKRLTLIERDPTRAARCRSAAAALDLAGGATTLDVRVGDVGDPACWPARPDVVVALHACGPAADATIDAAIAAGARRLLLVPCCYGEDVPFLAAAAARTEALGLPRQAELSGRVVRALVDGERALRLEVAGYHVELFAFVPLSVTPHNLLFRARHVGEPRRMADAAGRLAALRGEHLAHDRRGR